MASHCKTCGVKVNTLGVNRGPHHLVWSSINTAGVKFNTTVFAVQSFLLLLRKKGKTHAPPTNNKNKTKQENNNNKSNNKQTK